MEQFQTKVITSTHSRQLWKNCLPWNRSLVPKRLGTIALERSLLESLEALFYTWNSGSNTDICSPRALRVHMTTACPFPSLMSLGLQPALKQSKNLGGYRGTLCTILATFCKSKITSKRKVKKITLGGIFTLFNFVHKWKTVLIFYLIFKSTLYQMDFTYWDAVTIVSYR